MNKVQDWISRLKKGHMLSVIGVFLLIIIILGIILYQKQVQAKQVSENTYNMAFYELVDYVGNVETYLAKSLISTTPEQGAETLTILWREANMAQTYLARLPIESQELENTQKFLNQVSDYSYSLSRKNIYNESLGEEDLKNLQDLHTYSLELENTLNQLSEDINSGRITWGELTKKGNPVFAQQVSSESKDGFSSLEENFHEYSGLIYDGAYSEHVNEGQMKFLVDKEDIDEEKAKNIALDFIGRDRVDEITSNGYIENGKIPAYDFSAKLKDGDDVYSYISISKKGGNVITMNCNRDVVAETISPDDAKNIGLDYLTKKGFPNMKDTYYIIQDGIITINYAYNQDDVIMYPDLIKVKMALDNGEVLGLETSGYLNSHVIRDINNVKIDKETAKQTINKQLTIESEGLAVIPTKWNTEILCWEFKGKVNENEFLVYINAENGKEEDILVIKDTPNGVLTM